MDTEQPFSSPLTESAASPNDWRPLLGFLWRRTLRMIAAPLVMLTVGLLLLPLQITWPLIGALLALGALLYLPSTALIFRTRFLPRPPEADELLLADGTRVHAGDYLLTVRAIATENLVGTIPLALLALYATAFTGKIGAAVGLLCLAMGGYTVARTALDTLTGESIVHLSRGQPQRAIGLLRRAAGLPLPSRIRDPLLHLLAIAHFRAGDLPQMLAALDGLRSPTGPEEVLRAQAALADGDPSPARALLEGPPPSSDPPLLPEASPELLRALLALHDDQPERLLADQADWPRPPAHLSSRRARLRDLFLAAALAKERPEQARRRLRRSGWAAEQLPWIRTVWPDLGRHLGPLQPW